MIPFVGALVVMAGFIVTTGQGKERVVVKEVPVVKYVQVCPDTVQTTITREIIERWGRKVTTHADTTTVVRRCRHEGIGF